MTARLGKQFGLEEDGGTVLPLVFPDDFRRGSRTYITSLVDLLADKEVRGIIILGAPEATHVAIARIQDSWNGLPQLSFPVFSFFPQDDVLGMESAADFVLDKTQHADISGLASEEAVQTAAEVPELVEKSVHYMLMSGAPFEQNAKLYEVVKKLAEGKRIARYADPDTGLISINHFVLE
ncbi:MAG: DUF3798 domain-containing protein [Treponemataceae bacterium]|nr:DUF3798 domain-containing protein [Treponemataceae bacterium]